MDVKPGTVYVKSREGTSGYDIFWLEEGILRRVFRRNYALAQEYARSKQEALKKQGETPEPKQTYPFGDTVLGMDGSQGAPWVELLWQGAVLAATNPEPGPKGLQNALKAASIAATAARKYIGADQLSSELESGVDDDAFWDQLASHLQPWLEKRNVPEEDRQIVLKVLKGGAKQ